MEFHKKLCVSSRDHRRMSMCRRDALCVLHIQLILNKLLKKCEFSDRTLRNKINSKHKGPEV